MWKNWVRSFTSGSTIDDNESVHSVRAPCDNGNDFEADRRQLQATYESQMRANSVGSVTGTSFDENAKAGMYRCSSRNEDETKEPERSSEKGCDAPFSDIPDGGWRAWLCVLGSFCGITVTFGISNGTGTIQDYLATERLQQYSESDIGWLFSLWLFIMYAGSVQTGPVFDAYGPRVLLIPGCIGWVASLFILSVCKEYYQFILGFSVLGGFSTSMIFNPSVAVLGQWFHSKRSVATGISFVGGSAGGVFVPLMLENLFPRIGYGWSIRVLAFITLGLCAVACLTVKGRTTRDDVDWHEALPELKSLRNFDFAMCSAGVFFIEWGFFVPVIYLVGYARAQGLSSGYANAIIAYLNVGSSLGRVIPGYLADKYGCFNVVIASCFLTGIAICAIWIPAGVTKAGLTAFAVIFGFGSGSTISATPNCVANISPAADYGKRYGTAYSLASFAVLTGTPIAGSLTDHNFLGLQLFAGCSYLVAGVAFSLSRWKAAGSTKLF